VAKHTFATEDGERAWLLVPDLDLFLDCGVKGGSELEVS